METQKLQSDAAAFLALRLGCKPEYTIKLAGTLLQNGTLAWNGGSFTFDESAPCLLQLAPGLVSWGALQAMAQADRNSPFGTGKAWAEMSRRLRDDPDFADLKTHPQYSESSSGDLSDVQFDAFAAAFAAAQNPDQGSRPGIRDPHAAAAAAAQNRANHPDGAQARNNIRELEQSLMTDPQRSGFPLDAA